jgi:hypothetical protein
MPEQRTVTAITVDEGIEDTAPRHPKVRELCGALDIEHVFVSFEQVATGHGRNVCRRTRGRRALCGRLPEKVPEPQAKSWAWIIGLGHNLTTWPNCTDVIHAGDVDTARPLGPHDHVHQGGPAHPALARHPEKETFL